MMNPTPTPQAFGQTHSCGLCGSRDYALLYKGTMDPAEPLTPGEFTCTNVHFGRHPDLFRCKGCGLIVSHEIKNPQEILESYEDVIDETYVKEMPGRMLTFQRHLDDLEPFLPEGKKLLDVGAYAGVFLKVALNNQLDAYGVEPSQWAREFDPLLKGRYLGKTLEDLLPEHRGTFDVITLWDVIEHLPDPFLVLDQIFELLKPGGVFAMSTHNIASKYALVMRHQYPFLMRMHLVHFSHATIRQALGKSGFEVLKLYKHRRFLSVDYFVERLQSISPMLAMPPRMLAKALRLGRLFVPLPSFGLMNVFARKPL